MEVRNEGWKWRLKVLEELIKKRAELLKDFEFKTLDEIRGELLIECLIEITKSLRKPKQIGPFNEKSGSENVA